MRSLLGGEVNITASDAGSGSTVQQAVDSCSNLSYLHTLCNNVTLQVEWQALLQSSRNIRNAIEVDEGLSICQWLRNNVVSTPHLQSLFNVCRL